MSIRNFTQDDRDAVMAMVDTFYHSPAVDHEIPASHTADVFDEMCDGGSDRIRGLIIEHQGKMAGYCSLSFGYSTEAGGTVVILEEGYVLPAYRSLGLGGELLNFIKNDYRGKAARLRLEVAPTNTRAIALYERMGFKVLPYVQMIAENF